MTSENKYSRIHTCDLCGYSFSAEESPEHMTVVELNTDRSSKTPKLDFYLCPCCNSRVLRYAFMFMDGYSYNCSKRG